MSPAQDARSTAIVDLLTSWGIEHAFEAPGPDQPVRAAPVMDRHQSAPAQEHSGLPRPGRSCWPGLRRRRQATHFAASEPTGHSCATPQEGSGLIVETTLRDLALNSTSTARGQRKLPHRGIELRRRTPQRRRSSHVILRERHSEPSAQRRNTGSTKPRRSTAIRGRLGAQVKPFASKARSWPRR